jgi:5-hydroxyisourate hydrolase
MKGNLSTHVLDIQSGRLANGLSIALWRLDEGKLILLKNVVTNSEGRTDEPLLNNSEVQAGEYELVFQVGAYFGMDPERSFLNEVPLRFRIVDLRKAVMCPCWFPPGRTVPTAGVSEKNRACYRYRAREVR